MGEVGYIDVFFSTLGDSREYRCKKGNKKTFIKAIYKHFS
jgi:hypothetical protein